MSFEWKEIKLADAIEIIGGGTPKTSVPDYWGGSISWLSVVDFNDVPRYVDSAEKSITEKGLAESSTKLLNAGDLIISARGTVGALAQLKRSMAFNQSCYGIRGLNGISDTDYIFYVLKIAVEQLKRLAHGGVFDTITRDTFQNIQILLPSLKEQAAIAKFLGALDDSIHLLQETNVTLEAIAQALFKSWFVDFDPVRAKQEGRQPEGMDAETAALFPDSFEQSELGEIPRGWLLSTFRNTIEIIGGGTPKTSVAEYWGGNIPWFSVVDAPHISDVFVVDTEKHITDAGLKGSSAKLLAVGTTIISARGTVGRIALTGCPMAMNQSCYGLRGKAGDQYYTFFNTKRIVDQLKQRAHGSVFDTITQETFSGILVCYSSGNLIQCFEKLIEPLMLRIRENLLMANNLTSLRDTLLPRLISGQLRLPEIDSLLEESVL